MAILGDLKEYKDSWIKATLLNKIIIAFSIFFLLTPFASLSDDIFKWKGFFLTAINFYNSHIIVPSIKFTTSIGIPIHEDRMNILIISLLIIGSFIRGFWMRYKNGTKTLWKVLASISTLLFLYLLILYNSFTNNNSINNHFDNNENINSHAIVILFIIVILSLLSKEYSNQEKISRILPMIIAISVVCILGAINLGINK